MLDLLNSKQGSTTDGAGYLWYWRIPPNFKPLFRKLGGARLDVELFLGRGLGFSTLGTSGVQGSRVGE